MTDEEELSKSTRLIGLLAWIALEELKNLSYEKGPLIRYSDLKAHIIKEWEDPNSKVREKLAIFTESGDEKDKEFAEKETKPGKKTWHYYLGWAGTVLKRENYRTGERGYWKITDKGDQFLQEHRSEGDQKSAIEELQRNEQARRTEKSDQRKKEKPDEKKLVPEAEDKEFLPEDLDAEYDSEIKIVEEVEKHIEKLQSDKFRELVKYLFEGMGYRVRDYREEVRSQPSKYIDFIAQQDPLGFEGKIIRIHVKFYEKEKDSADIIKDSADIIKEFRSLNSICENSQLHGVIVSNMISFGDYTQAVEWRGIFPNVTLINLRNFIDLWIEHIDKIPQKGQEILPMMQRYELVKEEDEPKKD